MSKDKNEFICDTGIIKNLRRRTKKKIIERKLLTVYPHSIIIIYIVEPRYDKLINK